MRVVLEGCNGEWAQEHYLPLLVNKAAGGEIRLWAIDIQQQIKFATQNVAGLWQIARSKGNALYLHNIRDNVAPHEIPASIDYVFIVTPDRYHCEIAEFWLERLNNGGKIFIEKPLDVSLKKPREIKSKIGEDNIVYGFDHYLARAYPFLREQNHYLEKIGNISEIEFNILEPSSIPVSHIKTLDKGVIFDLFCHVLAVVGAIAVRNFTPSGAILQTVRKIEVKPAQYRNCPISGETFARIKFSISDNVKVSAMVGKGIAGSSDKRVKIYGEDGRIRLDFEENHFVCDYSSGQKDEGQLESNHVESFVEAVLKERGPLSAPGVLSFDSALAILELLCQAKSKVGKIPRYDIGTSAAEILKTRKTTRSSSRNF
jgi:predicted dehydrogenase